MVLLVLLDKVLGGLKAPYVHLGEKKNKDKRTDERTDKVTTSLLELLIAAKNKTESNNVYVIPIRILAVAIIYNVLMDDQVLCMFV